MLEMLDWIVPVTDAVVAVLLLLIGGNLGSFLNVVVHRLPRGESVVLGGSHCPACGAAIRWHDNVPVLGWMLLRGRCRDCAAEIAPRYPLVEALGALVIGGVAAVELLSGGGTFPGGTLAAARSGADNLLLRPDPGLIGLALFHAWLSFNLLLGAAVEADGSRVPRRWVGGVLIVTVVIVTSLDWLVPMGVFGDVGGHPAAGGWQGRFRGLAASSAGMACGAILGLRGTTAFRDGLVLAGAALGWQAVVVVWLLVPPTAWCRRGLSTLLPPDPPEDGAHATEAVAPGECRESFPFHPLTSSGVRGGGRRRLAAAAREELARPGSTAGDVAIATALHLLAWRWWVGLWW